MLPVIVSELVVLVDRNSVVLAFAFGVVLVLFFVRLALTTTR